MLTPILQVHNAGFAITEHTYIQIIKMMYLKVLITAEID